MKYVELNNETKECVAGDKDLLTQNDFNFSGAEFLSIHIQNKEVIFKVLTANFKVFEFKMNNASILDFEISKEASWFTDEDVISNILVAIESGAIYSVAINVKGGRDCRFTCVGLELVNVEEYSR